MLLGLRRRQTVFATMFFRDRFCLRRLLRHFLYLLRSRLDNALRSVVFLP